MALISAATKKHAQRQYKINELKKDLLKNAENISRLQRTILKKPPLKPKIDTTENSTLAIELSSKCAMMVEPRVKDGEFNYFLRLQSMGKSFDTIYIPIREHKHSLNLKKMGKTLGSFLIGNNEISIRYRIEVEQRNIGETVGGDTGKKTVLTLSDNNSTDMKADVHGHTLSSTMESLARKKKGSKGFRRAQDHRTNYINWSIKQINFSSYKQINLEKINNIFYKNKTSRLMSHFANAEIEKAIISKCELDGVHLNFQSSMYRSQRCSGCGLVRKANRKGKLYKCKNCGIELDSDLNAAKNHAISLFSLPGRLRHLKLNLKGFFWTPDGLFSLDGSELRVPDTYKEIL